MHDVILLSSSPTVLFSVVPIKVYVCYKLKVSARYITCSYTCQTHNHCLLHVCMYIHVLPSHNRKFIYLSIYIICNSCMTQTGMHEGPKKLFCHPKYSILYGALMIFVVGSGQE